MNRSAADARKATPAQGALLLLGSCLPILGAVLLAPLLPSIQAAFPDQPGVETLARMILAAPALSIAVIAPFAGAIADRYGRKRLLLWALPVYTLAGIAPLFLDSLPAIVGTRFVLGAAEALIMTICTTLLGDYFEGRTRERMLAAQAIATSLSAVLFAFLGGALGMESWRTPFWLYAVGVVFLPLAALLLWEPLPNDDAHRSGAARGQMPWRVLSVLYGLTFIMAIGFYVTNAQQAFLLAAAGMTNPAQAGAVNAASQAALFVTAIVFGFLRKRVSFPTLNAIGFVIAAAGLAGMGLAKTVPGIAGFGVLNGVGLGLLLPGLIAWIVGMLQLEQRGRGTGGFTAAFFFGQFMSPLVVLALAGVVGGLGPAIVVVAVATLLTAGAALAARRVAPGRPVAEGQS